jgi:hypothetical protein
VSVESDTNNGIEFGGALALLFIGLKLGGVITWSWLWVLCPLWMPLAFALVFLVIAPCAAVVGK